MHVSIVAAGPTAAGRRRGSFAFLVAPIAVGFLFVSVLAVRGQLAISVTPETQTVDEDDYAYADVVLTAQPDETVTVGMFRTSTKLSAPRPIRLTFTPQNWNTPQTVRWWARPDDDWNDERVVLTFSIPALEVVAKASVVIRDTLVGGPAIRLCGARLGSLAQDAPGEELDICWQSGKTIPSDRNLVIERQWKFGWRDSVENYRGWAPVGTGDEYTACGLSPSCVKFTAGELWRGTAMTFQMRLRRGQEVLALSPELEVQVPNSDAAELSAELTYIERLSTPETGPFVLQLVFTDPLVTIFTAERVQGLEAADLEVLNGTVTEVGYWKNGVYQVVVEPPAPGPSVTVSLPANRVEGVGEGLSSAGGNVYTRGNTASNTVALKTVLPEDYVDQMALSVRDAEVQEGPGARLEFRVSLTWIATGRTTVEYRTADGTALAGTDYEARSGELVFEPGDTWKTVAVTVHDDDHDEGEESMTLTLFNPSGAILTRAKATGVIVNADPMPRAWLGRFGRSVAEGVVDAVERRRLARGAKGLQVTTIGRGRDVTSFSYGHEVEDRGHFSVWGAGAYSSFRARHGVVGLSGDVSTGTLGADYEQGPWLGGLLLSRSVGDGDYGAPGGDGEIRAEVTGLYPHLSYRINDRLSVWGVLGHGAGDLRLTTPSGESLTVDMDVNMTAAGLRGGLLSRANGLSLDLMTDALYVRTSSDAMPGLAAARAEVNRVRLGLEGSYFMAVGESSSLVPTFEVAVRKDDGDAEMGLGVDVGAGLRFSHAGLSLVVDGRRLVGHETGGFEQWGVSGALTYDVDPGSDRGLSISLRPTFGRSSFGGAEALRSRQGLTALASSRPRDAGRRLDAVVAYGLPFLGGTGAPWLSLGSTGSSLDLRMGYRVGLVRTGDFDLRLDLAAMRRGGIAKGEADREIAVAATVRWL